MAESIKELRKICQKRIQLYNKKGEENTAPPTQEYFYDQFLRLVSIYITKIFLYTPITSNQVTILSIFVGILAGIAFTFPHPLYWIVGFLLLQLFHFLDAVDGEIARYRKGASPIGKYFDLMAHSVVIASFYMGVTIGIYNTINHPVVFIVGFICLITFLLSSLSNFLKNYLVYEYAIFYGGKESLKKTEPKPTKTIKTSSLKYFIRRMLGFDGLAFMALGVALLDWIFQPLILHIGQPLLINWRFAFLLISAFGGTFILIKKMQTTAKLKNRFD